MDEPNDGIFCTEPRDSNCIALLLLLLLFFLSSFQYIRICEFTNPVAFFFFAG